MGEDLEWFRENVCEKQDHDHGEGEELDCLLQTLARVRARKKQSRKV